MICKGSRKPTEPVKRWSLSILLSLICYPIPRKASQKRTPERSNSILHIRFPLSRWVPGRGGFVTSWKEECDMDQALFAVKFSYYVYPPGRWRKERHGR